MDGRKSFAVLSVALFLSVCFVGIVGTSEDSDALTHELPDDAWGRESAVDMNLVMTMTEVHNHYIIFAPVGCNVSITASGGYQASVTDGIGLTGGNSITGKLTVAGQFKIIFADGHTTYLTCNPVRDSISDTWDQLSYVEYVKIGGSVNIAMDEDYMGQPYLVESGYGLSIKDTNLVGTASAPGFCKYTLDTDGGTQYQFVCIIDAVSDYTVSFHGNGSSFNRDVVVHENTSTYLPKPVRPGYDFAGWYTSASGGSYIGGAGDSYTPVKSIDLYAHWTPQPVHITSAAPTEPVVTGNTFVYNVSTSIPASVSVSGPSWLSVSGNKVVGTPTAAGVYDVVLNVSTGHSADNQVFKITVIDRLTFESAPTGSILVSGA